MISIKYHSIFGYPLTKSELKKWQVAKEFSIINYQFSNKDGFYFEKGKEFLIKQRLEREKRSKKKLLIAKKAARIISKIPTIKFVGVTGSLAMMNSNENSDIDLMIVTSQGTLWSTRLFTYLLIHLFGFRRRFPMEKAEKDKLCFNLWLDESDLIWSESDRNIYTSHEIAQIMPLINKDKTYEKFLYLNRWILNYWPNSVKISRYRDTEIQSIEQKNRFISLYPFYLISLCMEKLAFKLQYLYMKNKITREVISPTRAIFHPQDWGKIVLKKLKI